MLDRRTVLRRSAGALGTATLAGGAGCIFPTESSSSSSTETFLSSLPDPRPHVVPNFHCAYGYDPATLQAELGGTNAMPELVGRLLDVIGQMEGTTSEDIHRLSGQTIRQIGHPGTDVTFVTPAGTDLIAEGSIGVDGATSWLASEDSLSSLGRSRGYRRFGNDQPIQAFVVDDGSFGYGTREGADVAPDALANSIVTGIGDDDVPVEETTPELAATVDALPSGVATIATRFDLVAERPDIGSEASDATASSLVAAGVSSSLDGDAVDVTRILRYRRGRVAPVDAVRTAVDAAVEASHFHDADWTVSASGRSVRIEGSVGTAALADASDTLRRAVPVSAYSNLPVPIDPGELGRDAPPRVAWQLSVQDDGRVAIVHGAGPSVEDLHVAYTVDGERVRERWAGPVEEEDRFVTSQAPADGSVVDIVWARGTANETILTRAQLA